MLRTFAFTLIGILILGSCNQKPGRTDTDAEITTYYLIRHAEKDRTDPENKDPVLTEEGLARAERWRNYFDTIQLDAVYSTNYKRTLSTARPTADSKGLAIKEYEIDYVFSSAFREDTKGKKVLVVGHSNTTPPLANELLGSQRFADMKDNDNSSLYVVSFKDSIADVEVRTVE